jgi:hypothetical protein
VEVDRLGWLSSGRFIRALAPIAGIALVAAVLYNATSVDRIPPSCQIKLSATAVDGRALTLTGINLVFSEKVQHDTAERAFSVAPYVPGSFHWQGQTLIFTPSSKLPLNATFQARLAAGVTDIAGNTQGKDQTLSFTTVGPPQVKSVDPGPGETSVAIDSKIVITFDRNMDGVRVMSGLSIEPTFQYTATWKENVLTIVPSSPLFFSTTYMVRIGGPAVDTDGTPLAAPFQLNFATVDMGLRLTSLVPAANVAGASVHTPIAVVYDGPVDPNSIQNAITLTPPVSGKIQLEALPSDTQPVPLASGATPRPTLPPAPANVLEFIPDSPLAAHTTYQVTLGAGVRRIDGEASSPASWTFTTGEPPATGQNQIAFLSARGGVLNVWMMNPDGSNQRQVTAELVPVSGFDISGDGSTLVYAAGGVVKRMSIGGDNLRVLTAGGLFEYAPTFTPDGTGVVVARRDASGSDLGYWRIPLVSGQDQQQVTADGATAMGTVTAAAGGLVAAPGLPAWAPRSAFSPDGAKMLIVRGSDDRLELVDMAGTAPPVPFALTGNSRPIWDATNGSFYVVALADGSKVWSTYRITPEGLATAAQPAVADLSIDNQGRMASIFAVADGSVHLGYAASSQGPAAQILPPDPAVEESSPSFSPDGSTIVFGRVMAADHTISAGIWMVRSNGSGLANLSPDGAFPRWLP